LLGFDELVLIKGRCVECRWKQGEQVLTDSISRSRALLEMGGVNSISITIEERPRSNDNALPRRELFASLGRSLRKQVAVVLHQPETTIREMLEKDPESETCVAPRRAHLRALLRQAPLDGSTAAPTEGLRWAKVMIDEARCSACGICAHLCPTAAISQVREAGYEVISCRSSLCTNCDLCQQACPEAAIRFEEWATLSEALDDEWKVLARVGMSECGACGNTIPARRQGLCPTCEKRQACSAYVEPQRDERSQE